MLEEQLSAQDLQDGVTLRKITQDPEVMAALGRVVKKIHDDHVGAFAIDGDGTRTRKWLKGVLEACSVFMPAIRSRVEDSERVVAEREDVMVEVASPAMDGQGSGDLV